MREVGKPLQVTLIVPMIHVTFKKQIAIRLMLVLHFSYLYLLKNLTGISILHSVRYVLPKFLNNFNKLFTFCHNDWTYLLNFCQNIDDRQIVCVKCLYGPRLICVLGQICISFKKEQLKFELTIKKYLMASVGKTILK